MTRQHNGDDDKNKALKRSSSEIQNILKNQKEKPRDVRDGVIAGTGYIVQGAIGAAGIAVLTPSVAVHEGTTQKGGGGIVRGMSAGTVGLVKGTVRAANVAVGGVIEGSRQIVYGVAATPAAVTEPRKGKWWNDVESKWVETNLEEEETQLEDVPEDDADILGPFQKQFQQQQQTKYGLNGRKVKDGLLYDVLEVPYDADEATIKRKYYILARKYSPDRAGNKGNEAVAKKFELLGQAYIVLKNKKYRKRYDRIGWDAFVNRKNIPKEDDDDDEEEEETMVDPFIFYAFLFGSDKFYNYFGRLAAATSASVGDSPNVTLEQARLIQKRRVTRLAIKLAERLDPWTAGEEDFSKEAWTAEAQDLTRASYGTELVHVVGKVYTLIAVEFLGSLDSGIGLPSVSEWASCQWAYMKKRQSNARLSIRQREISMTQHIVKEQVSEELGNAVTKRQQEESKKRLETKMIVPVLKALWTMTVVDITSTLHETAQMVLFDKSVDDETRKRRGEGLKVLGEIFAQVERPKEETMDMAAQKDYEELAFMAVLETIMRKEEMARANEYKA